jgi:hypothetical protein
MVSGLKGRTGTYEWEKFLNWAWIHRLRGDTKPTWPLCIRLCMPRASLTILAGLRKQEMRGHRELGS